MTSSTSMKVRKATALKAMSHMKTTAPPVEIPIATTGVCTVSHDGVAWFTPP
jgi:hypothetical protein